MGDSTGSLRTRIYVLLIAGGALVAVSFFAAWFYGYTSWKAWWVSNFFHLIGGGYAFYLIRAVHISTARYHRTRTASWMEALIFIAGAVVLGVSWEWFEFVLDLYRIWYWGLDSFMTYPDTIGDLFLDTFGAVVAAVILFRRGNTT